MSIYEEIKAIEEEIKTTKYNKSTQYHIGRLKARLARLKENLEKKPSSKGIVTSVKKSGDATVLLVGFPSVGKSTLLNKLTNASSKIGNYDFTTLDIVPGVMEYNSSKIQIFDVPGVVSGASSGKGMGRKILSFLRLADLVIILIDDLKQVGIIEDELYKAGFRLNQNPPDVKIHKKATGGISIGSVARLTKINSKMIKGILTEYKIHNADVIIREDVTPERFIDALSKNRVYVPSVTIFNKVDMLSSENIKNIANRVDSLISAKNEINLEDVKKLIWKRLGFMRIYMKKIGEEPNLSEALVVKTNSTVRDVAERIHKDFKSDLKYARIWGHSAKFPGQRVGLMHILKDKDIVELHTKR